MGQIVLTEQGDTFIGGTAIQYMSRDNWRDLRADCEKRLSNGYAVIVLFEGKVIGQFFKPDEWMDFTGVPLGQARYIVLVSDLKNANKVRRDFMKQSGDEFKVVAP